VVILAGELLKESKSFVEEGVHPRIIVRGFRAACELAKAKIKELAITLDSGSKDSAAFVLLSPPCLRFVALITATAVRITQCAVR